MGLIRAAISAVGGTMADQWKEFLSVNHWMRMFLR